MSVSSLRSAVAFLTVIPAAAADGAPGARLGRAYFPLVGAALGLAAGVVFFVSAVLTSPLLGAAIAIGVFAALTGALHLDGLADAADGLLGAGTVQRRLEVMRDPRVGSFGVTAVALVLLADVAALASNAPVRGLVALVVAGALSRWAMLGVVALVPYVRESGLGQAAWGAHRIFDLALGSAFAALACALDWRHALLAVLLVALTAAAVGAIAHRRIGGATGDVYGATAELCQLAALVAFAVSL